MVHYRIIPPNLRLYVIINAHSIYTIQLLRRIARQDIHPFEETLERRIRISFILMDIFHGNTQYSDQKGYDTKAFPHYIRNKIPHSIG